MKRLICVIATLILSSARAQSAPKAEINPAAAALFERAERAIGAAKTLVFDYQIASNAPAYPAESGHIQWQTGAATLLSQTFVTTAGTGHIFADAITIYYTRFDGHSGRYPWKSRLGFWGALPWQMPENLERLLRGSKIYASSTPALRLQILPAQTVEGVLCDGALLDESASGGDQTRFWFERKSGLLRRESWTVNLPASPTKVWVQTRYTRAQINAVIAPDSWASSAERAAPLLPNRDAADAAAQATADAAAQAKVTPVEN